MKNLNVRSWLTGLAVLSLFSGISINGKWNFVYKFSFVDGPDMIYRQFINHQTSFRLLIGWLIIAISHILLLSLPFLSYHKINFRKWVFYVPLAFILTQFTLWSVLSFILIPFIALWIGLIFYVKAKQIDQI